MALNLWTTTGGKPSSYNPLPTGYSGTYITLQPGTYTVSYYAYSPSSAVLKFYKNAGEVNFQNNLTPVRTFYTTTFTVNVVESTQFYDNNSKGDIVIDSISVVRKPLSKNTVNGADGFLSGKWNFSNVLGGYTIINDSSFRMTPSSTYRNFNLYVPIPLGGGQYTLSFVKDNLAGYAQIKWVDVNNVETIIADGISLNVPATPYNYTFTVPSNAVKINILFFNHASGSLNVPYTFSNVMLNLGSISSPYEPKRGDKMVTPNARKNLLPTVQSSNNGSAANYIGNDSTFELKVTPTATWNGFYYSLANIYPISWLQGRSMTVSFVVGELTNGTGGEVSLTTHHPTGSEVYAGSINITPSMIGTNQTFTCTVPADATYLNLCVRSTSTIPSYIHVKNLQVEQNTVATTFIPYAVQVNPKPKRAIASAKKGLSFNGTTDSISYSNGLLSLGANPISAEAWVSGDFKKSIFGHGPYSAGNMFNLYVTASSQAGIDNGGGGVTSGTNYLIPNALNHIVATYDGATVSIYLNGVFRNSYPRVLNMGDGSNTIGDGYSGKGSGTIYKVVAYNRCLSSTEIANNYTNGVGSVASGSVLNYDFTNSRTVTGTTVLPNPPQANLIPSFDDPGWTLSANAKVLGRDVLHLDATANSQSSSIDFPILPNTTYMLTSFKNDAYITAYWLDANNTATWLNEIYKNVSLNRTLTTPSNAVKLRILCHNYTLGAGPFDFYRPQLYRLDGTQGTVNGSPIVQNKHAKRRLYAKR
jgi:Concanavalin A-like lectin/glucanases superfamily